MKRRLKFKLRQTLFSSELAEVQQYFESRQLTGLLEQDPSLLLKCTRAYLWSGLDSHTRVKAQLAFLDWFENKFKLPYTLAFYEPERVGVAKIQHNNTEFDVMLGPSRGLGPEGELMLTLHVNGTLLMRSSISVLPAHMLGLPGNGHALFLGCFQGVSNTKDLIKQATQALERTKPGFFLLNALQALAQAWGLVGIVGVADKKHAYANYFSLSKRISMSYDELWQQLGAIEQTAQGHWLMPLVWQPRPEHEVESKKRSALKRRNALRQQFTDTCLFGFQQLGAEHGSQLA
ncbi:MAG TPA: DUF535 family protein [Limnohabitans sp.]|uniref:DUF535 family protein n=1 Tax=Limnohabitans sp. TaxID=1907725 RepID=UPI002CCF16B1|nr:DUF535 family protein [Limnohabitans sp.]HQR87118.1 DUF535 family protein [Limnohabitans sp.]HQS27834.1 DUF535 family protein [Limnohabitans sp.]